MKHRSAFITRRIGANLETRRRELGLRQRDVAERMRVSPTMYARLERGDHDSGITLWLDAMWALEMTPEQLLDRLTERIP